MKYINAKDCLPEELLEEIMKHVEGTYIYIPKKEANKSSYPFHDEQRKVTYNPKHKTEMPKTTAHFLDIGPVFIVNS